MTITDKKNYELYLKAKAYRDGLTGLLNRGGFENTSQGIIDQKSSIQETSVFMMDIDKFKNINDTYGHINGDKVLQDLAMRFALFYRLEIH